MAFLLCTYNILADGYINPAWYPAVPAALLQPVSRRAAVLRRIDAIAADVLCLQEVEEPMHQALLAHLGPQGYVGHYARKGGGKRDGCATFVRSATLGVGAMERVAYQDGDGQADSGHVALLLQVRHQGLGIVIANSHLRWAPPGAGDAPLRQLRQMVAAALAMEGEAQVLCGDFNMTPEHPGLALLRQAHLTGIWDHAPPQATCIANKRAQCVDHVFCSALLRGTVRPLLHLDSSTSLPASDEPSDHLPVLVDLSSVESDQSPPTTVCS